MKHLIFDLEIVRGIPPKHPDEIVHGIKYCKGWIDFQGMGIACLSYAALSPNDETVGVIWGDEIYQIRKLLQGYKDCDFQIGGFNSKKFDDNLLQANGIEIESDFDILEMTLAAANMTDCAYWKMQPKRSYSLDSIVQANGMKKTGHGALAPIWWQQGEHQKVINYCLNDAVIERAVLRKLLNNELIDPNTNEKLIWSTN